MNLRELPTHVRRELAERCGGNNSAAGDTRIALKAVNCACYREIERCMEGGDFALISDEADGAFTAQARSSSTLEFQRLIYELEGIETHD